MPTLTMTHFPSHCIHFAPKLVVFPWFAVVCTHRLTQVYNRGTQRDTYLAVESCLSSQENGHHWWNDYRL